MLEAAISFSAMWELAHPNKNDLREEGLRAIDRFWWRCPERQSSCFVNRLPNKRWRDVQPVNYDTPARDRQSCMAAIVGTLDARGFLREYVCDFLHIGSGTHSVHLQLWRAESLEYRFMVCAMKGDLAHKALRNFVLGLPGAC